MRSDEITWLLKLAAARPMTPEERERQLVSFALGNAGFSDPSITRADLEAAVANSRGAR